MNISETDGAKNWLLELREAVADAELTEERLDALRSRAKAPRLSNLDGMPHGDGFTADRVGDIVARIEETAAENSRLWRRVGDLRRERERAICQIKCRGFADLRGVLRLRYIDGESWPDTAFVLFGNRTDFPDREDSYVRRCFKLHGRALHELAKILPLEAGQENNT